MADVYARGLRFHVQRFGNDRNNPVVVFLHGLVMDNLSSWYFSCAPAMAKVADVILYDLRGHGRSERPPTGYTLADHVADLAALLDALGETRPVHLVGNSFGGLLALAFAAAHTSRTAAVGLVDGHVGHGGFAAMMEATLRKEGEARDLAIAASFKTWLGRHSERKRTRLADHAQELIAQTTLVADIAATPALDAAKVTVPVLGVYGEKSDLYEEAKRLLATASQVRLITLPGCSHSVLWEETQLVKELLVRFLAGELTALIKVSGLPDSREWAAV